MPCIVKSWLYVSGLSTSSSGAASCTRMTSASKPARKKKMNARVDVPDADALVVDGREEARDTGRVLPLLGELFLESPRRGRARPDVVP